MVECSLLLLSQKESGVEYAERTTIQGLGISTLCNSESPCATKRIRIVHVPLLKSGVILLGMLAPILAGNVAGGRNGSSLQR